MHRTSTGHYNEVDCPHAGAALIPLDRNCPGYASHSRREMYPPPHLVAEKLLKRRPSGVNKDYFKPAGDQLNILAAAWIQAMVVSLPPSASESRAPPWVAWVSREVGVEERGERGSRASDLNGRETGAAQDYPPGLNDS